MNDNQVFGTSLLNEHQHLSTRLRSIDRDLYEAERLLNGDLPKSDLFEINSDITKEESEELLILIHAARQIVCDLHSVLGLTTKRENVRSWLLGHLSIVWTILEDCHAEKLKGFGEISPDLSRALDPSIDQLIEKVNLIRKSSTQSAFR
ncbi:MAG TPA: hypothetical protein VGQ39_14060 [Pyrinomonadaceae bacterium]|jgi:hypothetical protein|nr:hypothetical protein [Pyrinomonadaceae bacterium]